MRVPKDGFVQSGELRLHYLEWGDPAAPLLLLLHGGSAHAHWWDSFAAAVAGDHHVVGLDLRGHGDSDRAAPERYALDDYVADVRALLAALGASRVSLAGHSMGALIATAFAADSPLPVDCVVLIDIRLTGLSDRGRRMLQWLATWPHPVYESRQEAVRRFRLLPSIHATDPALLERVAHHGLRDLPDGSSTPKFDRAALSDAATRDVSAELRRLRCPILFIRGAGSTVVPRRALDEVRAAAPHARVVELPDAYHHVMLDNPEEFSRVVRMFLRDVRAGRAATAR